MLPRRIEGEIDYVRGRVEDVVKNGLPEVGWEGDPLLSVAIDRRHDDLVIRDHAFTPPQIIMRRSFAEEGMGVLKDFRSLAKRLAAAQFKGKPKGAMTILERVEARNEAVKAEKAKVNRAFHEEGAERLAWAIGKAL